MTASGLLQISGVVVDLIYSVESVPLAGEEAIVSGFEITTGGGFNAMIACKRAGLDVTYGGPIGTGPFADIAIAGLKTAKIPILCPQKPPIDQGCCTVMVNPDGERTFIASDGAEGQVTDADMIQVNTGRYETCLLSGYALHYCGSHAALTRWLNSDVALGTLFFDPSPIVAALRPDALKAALHRADWISANTREAAVITGQSDPHAAALTLSKAKHGGAIVRDGANGCYIATDGKCVHSPGFNVAAIDTNGAGDTHIGSFIAALSQGRTPVQAAQYANAAAALSTTRPGPATAPFPIEVEQLIKQARST